MSSHVLSLVQSDAWRGISGDSGGFPFILRYRIPILQAGQTLPYTKLLRCVWAYAPQDSGDMPSSIESERMAIFEDRLCHAWEHSEVSILAAVLTFDGARQWVFYSKDVSASAKLLSEMPQEAEAYPIELDTQEDPNWEYVRDQIIGSRDEA
jgi:hypothetical protein